MSESDSLVYVNNTVSMAILKSLVRDGVLDPRKTTLLLGRPMTGDFSKYKEVLPYPFKASLHMLGQVRFIGYYLDAKKLVDRAFKSGVDNCYIVNNDNLICNYILRLAEKAANVAVSVIAEGFMNYQKIEVDDRAFWRWFLKPVIARLLGYRYEKPSTHLSGAYENAVEKVYVFNENGVYAPKEKVILQKVFSTEQASSERHEVGLLYLETALWQWMSEDFWMVFADSFAEYLNSYNTTIYIKEHPNYPPSDYLRKRLNNYEILNLDGGIEDSLAAYRYNTIVSHWCTALGTLKMIDPDLRCIDYGSNYYTEKAYSVDSDLRSVFDVFGIEVVDM